MVRIQYHDVGARIGAHVAGKRKKCVKKVQNFTKSALFGGDFLHLVHRRVAENPPQKVAILTLLGLFKVFSHIFCDFLSHEPQYVL